MRGVCWCVWEKMRCASVVVFYNSIKINLAALKVRRLVNGRECLIEMCYNWKLLGVVLIWDKLLGSKRKIVESECVKAAVENLCSAKISPGQSCERVCVHLFLLIISLFIQKYVFIGSTVLWGDDESCWKNSSSLCIIRILLNMWCEWEEFQK